MKNNEVRLKIGEIQRSAYERYKLIWLAEHGYSLLDAIQSFVMHTGVVDDDDAIEEEFANWELESGMGGCLYACYNEFLDNELADKEIRKKYLSKEDCAFLDTCKLIAQDLSDDEDEKFKIETMVPIGAVGYIVVCGSGSPYRVEQAKVVEIRVNRDLETITSFETTDKYGSVYKLDNRKIDTRFFLNKEDALRQAGELNGDTNSDKDDAEERDICAESWEITN